MKSSKNYPRNTGYKAVNIRIIPLYLRPLTSVIFCNDLDISCVGLECTYKVIKLFAMSKSINQKIGEEYERDYAMRQGVKLRCTQNRCEYFDQLHSCPCFSTYLAKLFYDVTW